VPSSDPYVEIVNLIKAYPNPTGDPIKVVDGFNLRIPKGEMIGLLGHSGCGKSTVLTMVAGLNEISAGDVVVDHQTIDGPGPDRAVVFQSPCLLPWFSAFKNVMLGIKRVYAHATKQEQHDICEYYLSIVGLADSMHKMPKEMSGGMQQRVGIARAIALKPKMLLLDEPFGRLDSLTRMELQDVILGILDQEKITTMLVTHDVDEAIYMCDRVCMMTNGPGAKVGKLVECPFERPRNRKEVMNDDCYYEKRDEILKFLEEHDKSKQRAAVRETSGIDESSIEPEFESEIKTDPVEIQEEQTVGAA